MTGEGPVRRGLSEAVIPVTMIVVWERWAF